MNKYLAAMQRSEENDPALGKTRVSARGGRTEETLDERRLFCLTNSFNFTCSCKQQTRTGRKSSGNSCQNNFCSLSLVFFFTEQSSHCCD